MAEVLISQAQERLKDGIPRGVLYVVVEPDMKRADAEYRWDTTDGFCFSMENSVARMVAARIIEFLETTDETTSTGDEDENNQPRLILDTLKIQARLHLPGPLNNVLLEDIAKAYDTAARFIVAILRAETVDDVHDAYCAAMQAIARFDALLPDGSFPVLPKNLRKAACELREHTIARLKDEDVDAGANLPEPGSDTPLTVEVSSRHNHQMQEDDTPRGALFVVIKPHVALGDAEYCWRTTCGFCFRVERSAARMLAEKIVEYLNTTDTTTRTDHC